MRGVRLLAVIGLAVLLGAAPAVVACAGGAGPVGCCAMKGSNHPAGDGDSHVPAMPTCHGDPSSWSGAPMDCCGVGSSQQAPAHRSSGPDLVLPAGAQRAHRLPPSLEIDGPSMKPRSFLPRTHDPGLYTLLSSFLL